MTKIDTFPYFCLTGFWYRRRRKYPDAGRTAPLRKGQTRTQIVTGSKMEYENKLVLAPMVRVVSSVTFRKLSSFSA